MTVVILKVTSLDKSVHCIFLIPLMLLVRNYLNMKSIRYANSILWGILLSYLLIPYHICITFDESSFLGCHSNLYQTMIHIENNINNTLQMIESVLYQNNRWAVSSLLLIYLLWQIIKMFRTVYRSAVIEPDDRIKECLEQFHLRRSVTVMRNDTVCVPITYGLFCPKIILQSKILKDDKLLKYVLIHELTHIKKFDIVINHLKYIAACVYWYNILVLAVCKYVEEDLEILCDKLVVDRTRYIKGNKKEYLEVMLEFVEVEENKSKLSLRLNPTLERMRVMKHNKVTFSGIISLVLVCMVSATSFANVRAFEDGRVTCTGVSVKRDYSMNQDNRVRRMNNTEYTQKVGEKSFLPMLKSINLRQSESLDGYQSEIYSFDMSSKNTAMHNGFAVKISNVSCRGGIDYEIIIQEDDTVIYEDRFYDSTTLAVKAKRDKTYKVVIINRKPKTLKYKIAINSYVR